MVQHIGVIGLGNMGSTFARRLVADDEYDVYGYDIDDDALHASADEGVTPTESITDLVQSVEIVLTSLPTPSIVKHVYVGEGGIKDAESEVIALETSTIDPETTETIAESLEGSEVAMLDSPVSGGVGRAKTGTLTVMVGGDRNRFDDEQVQGVLSTLGSDIYYAGEAGSGHTLKLLNNIMGLTNTAVAMEVSALAAELDVDWETYLDVLGRSAASSYSFRKYVPRALNRDFDATFTLELGQKDANLANRLAESSDYPSILTTMANQIRSEALAKGLGDESNSAIVKIFEESTTNRVESESEIDEDYLSWEEKN